MLVGEGGILQQAQSAKDETEIAEEIERIGTNFYTTLQKAIDVI